MKLNSLEELYDTETYVKEKTGVSFREPEAYIQPFTEKLGDNVENYDIEVDVPTGTVENNDGEAIRHQAFGRVKVEAKLKGYDVETDDHHYTTAGILYALDTQHPVIKTYVGTVASACTNLCVFANGQVNTAQLLQGTEQVYEALDRYLENVDTTVQNFKSFYDKLKNTQLNHSGVKDSELEKLLGHLMVEFHNNKNIGTNPLNFAVKQLFGNSSRYAIKDGVTDEWNVYSAITQYITDKTNIAEKPTKTLNISQVFNQIHKN